jgi:hypothetical protein
MTTAVSYKLAEAKARLGRLLERVNVLLCTAMRGQRGWKPKPREVILNSTDGLDWATRCRCDALYYVPRSKL